MTALQHVFTAIIRDKRAASGKVQVWSTLSQQEADATARLLLEACVGATSGRAEARP